MEKPRKFVNDALSHILLECPYPVTVNKRHKSRFRKAAYSKYFEISAETGTMICALQQNGPDVILECVPETPDGTGKSYVMSCETDPEEILRELLYILH